MGSVGVQEHFDRYAGTLDHWRQLSWYYYEELTRILKVVLGPLGTRTVLDVGCGRGDLLAALSPRSGVGLDLSPAVIELAKKRHQGLPLEFVAVDFASYEPPGPFDHVLAVNVLEHLPREEVTPFVHRLLHCTTRSAVILGTEPTAGWLLEVAERLGQKMPEGPHRWRNILEGEEILRRGGPTWQVRTTKWLSVPRRIPGLWRLNRSSHLWGFIRLVEAQRAAPPHLG